MNGSYSVQEDFLEFNLEDSSNKFQLKVVIFVEDTHVSNTTKITQYIQHKLIGGENFFKTVKGLKNFSNDLIYINKMCLNPGFVERELKLTQNYDQDFLKGEPFLSVPQSDLSYERG